MLAKDIFGQREMQTVLKHEERAISTHQRPAAWQSIVARLLRVRNNDELNKLVCELDGSIGETLATLSTQVCDLHDCLKARQPTAPVLTQTIALANHTLQQIHLSYLLYSPLFDENEFFLATHHYAEALVQLRNNQVKPMPRSPIERIPHLATAAFSLFRGGLTFLDGRRAPRIANIPVTFDPDIVSLKIYEYRNGVPSEVMEHLGSNGDATLLRELGEEVDDFSDQFEVVCGNTVLVITSVQDVQRPVYLRPA